MARFGEIWRHMASKSGRPHITHKPPERARVGKTQPRIVQARSRIGFVSRFGGREFSGIWAGGEVLGSELARYGENMVRYGDIDEIWRDMVRYGQNARDLARYGEIW